MMVVLCVVAVDVWIDVFLTFDTKNKTDLKHETETIQQKMESKQWPR